MISYLITNQKNKFVLIWSDIFKDVNFSHSACAIFFYFILFQFKIIKMILFFAH